MTLRAMRYVVRTRNKLLEEHRYQSKARARLEARSWSKQLNVRVYVTDLDGFVRHAFERGEEVDFAYNYQLKSGYTRDRKHVPKTHHGTPWWAGRSERPYTELEDEAVIASRREHCGYCGASGHGFTKDAKTKMLLCPRCEKHVIAVRARAAKGVMGDPSRRRLQAKIRLLIREGYPPKQAVAIAMKMLGMKRR